MSEYKELNFTKDELKNLIEKQTTVFYKELPYFIETNTAYKIIPYIYSKELIELIDSVFKSLKDAVFFSSVPYEEKCKKFDYGIFSTPLIGSDAQFLKRVFYYDNLVNKRAIERWFVPTGRLFTRNLRDILLKIAKEFSGDTSPLYLFLLTLISVFKDKKLEFLALNLGKVVPDRKDLYFSNLFFFLFKLIIELITIELKDEHFERFLKLQLLSPLFFYETKGVFLRTPFNYWHLTKNLYLLLEEKDIYNNYNGKSDLPDMLFTKEIYSEALLNAKLKDIRNLMFEVFAENYVEDEFMVKLVYIYYTPALFFNFLKERSFREELYDIKKASKLFQVKEKKQILLNFIETVEERIASNQKEKNIEDVNNSFDNYITYKCHEQFAENITNILKNIKDRRKEEIDLRNEYEKGRLYYFATDTSEIFKKAEKQESAAIYIDIRDFSKKTFHLKEDAVIELLKEKLYQPLLRYAGSRKSIGNISLVNIMGDAFVFLGPIEEIIKLSLVVKKNINDYKKGLEHLIDDASKKELMALDLGIFISYGKTPIINNITSEFGSHTIAIGEIINEASRGARRDVNALNRLNYMISAESNKKNVNLKSPFELHILEGYELTMPPTIEFSLLKLENETEIKEAMEQFFEQAKSELFIYSDAKETIWKKRKFIYNVGIGLTENALMAFVNSQKAFSEIKRVNIKTDSFSEHIKGKFFFRNNVLDILYINNKRTNEKFLFRQEGQIDFKGIYRENTVWELLTEDLDIYHQIISMIGNY